MRDKCGQAVVNDKASRVSARLPGTGRGRPLSAVRLFSPPAGLLRTIAVVACAVAFAMASGASAEWTTARGNAQRTGNLDGQAGPTKPKVLWSLRAPEQFISPPVPVGQRMFIGGLGAFNTGTLHCLALDDAPNRELWAKAAPFIKRPTVCSPAVAGGLVIFGDGMHQTDDAILYALHAETGQPVWQLPMPGKLIHMEGSPTVDNARVFIGAGDGGVVCVELAKTVLDGQELRLAVARVQGVGDGPGRRVRGVGGK